MSILYSTIFFWNVPDSLKFVGTLKIRNHLNNIVENQ